MERRSPVDVAGWTPSFIGGHVALDFVNTVAWRGRGDRAVDRLPSGTALVRWVTAAGLLDERRAGELERRAEAEPGRAADALDAARGLREELHRVLHPVATGGRPAERDVDLLRTRITDALSRAEITTVVPLHWDVPVRSLPDLPPLLALSAWRLLESGDLTRLRMCRDDACGWLFLDRTRNASRMWCSSADCGNRTRARRHYRRRHDPRALPSPGAAEEGSK